MHSVLASFLRKNNTASRLVTWEGNKACSAGLLQQEALQTINDLTNRAPRVNRDRFAITFLDRLKSLETGGWQGLDIIWQIADEAVIS